MNRNRGIALYLINPIIQRNSPEIDYVLEIPANDGAAAACSGHRDMQGVNIPPAANHARRQIGFLNS